MFSVFRGPLIFGGKRVLVVAAPQYRAAANTAMGWKNANLRSEMSRLLRLAGVSILATIVPFDAGELANGTATRVPLHVVCSWLGNSPRIAQQSYLVVTDDDFAKALGFAKIMAEE